jgi:hypothetical protein
MLRDAKTPDKANGNARLPQPSVRAIAAINRRRPKESLCRENHLDVNSCMRLDSPQQY